MSFKWKEGNYSHYHCTFATGFVYLTAWYDGIHGSGFLFKVNGYTTGLSYDSLGKAKRAAESFAKAHIIKAAQEMGLRCSE